MAKDYYATKQLKSKTYPALTHAVSQTVNILLY